MKLTEAAKKVRRKRAARPIYLTPVRIIDVHGEEHAVFAPCHDIDRRLARERKFRVGHEYRAEIKQSRNVKFHRLAHAVGHLLVDNVEEFRDLDAHAALKAVQLQSGICCEVIEMDASPIIAAVLAIVDQALGAGAAKVLQAILPEIKTIPVKRARSLAFDELEEDEFANFFNGITAYIGEHYASVMLDDVRAEYWQMVAGDRRAA